jgi:hypothetical protein
MSEVTNSESVVEGQEPAAPAEQDPVKNIKAEFARKTSNLEEKLAHTNAQLEQMLALVQQSVKPTETKPSKSARDLLYDDPDAFVSEVTEKATRKAQEEARALAAQQSAINNVIADYSSKYPEIAQQGSEAMQLAVKFGNELPKHLKGTAEGAELAMSKAIAELGLAPVSRRKKVEEPEVVGGAARSTNSQAKKPDAKLDENTLALAQLMGVDLKDKKRVENIAKAASRKNWLKYE